jgi:hypothetical protein
MRHEIRRSSCWVPAPTPVKAGRKPESSAPDRPGRASQAAGRAREARRGVLDPFSASTVQRGRKTEPECSLE